MVKPINTSAKQPKKKNKRRHWIEKELLLSSQACKIPNDLDKPDIAKTIEDNDLSPVDMFKMCFDEDFMEHICSESQKYAAQKVSHNTKCQLRNCTSILEYCSSLIM